jgi:hypothetical protein
MQFIQSIRHNKNMRAMYREKINKTNKPKDAKEVIKEATH